MRALVTGADGFVGQWLVRALLEAGDEVIGTMHAPAPALTTLDTSHAASVRWLQTDIRDAEGTSRTVASARPNIVYHLAAQSSGALSFEKPHDTFQINVAGTLNVLEACRANAPDAAFLFVGSSEVYGAVDESELPIAETAPPRPHSPYAASKAAAEMYALQYARSGWLRVVATRSFNHTGPGQGPGFVVPGFAKQVASGKPISHGNLNARRDFTDVRDVVAAYRLLAQRGKSATAYNVCSGRAVSMKDVLADLIRIARRTGDIVAQQDPARLRPIDAAVVVGDPAAIKRDTGWEPKIPLDRTLHDVYAWCLSH